MTYDEAIKDINIIKISNKAANKYKKVMRVEDLSQCRHIGIWKACKLYNPDKSSLHTYIYNYVQWECKKYITKYQQYSNSNYKDPIVVSNNNLDTVKCLLEDKEYNLLVDRYIGRYTVKELSSKYNLTEWKVKTQLNVILAKIKDFLI